MNTSKTSFTRNIRGYLNASRLTSVFSAGRIKRTTPSLTADPVEPVDAVFTELQNSYSGDEHEAHRQSVTQQLLSSHVLDNLLQLQNEISAIDDQHHDNAGENAKAVRAYQRAQDSFTETDDNTVYYIH